MLQLIFSTIDVRKPCKLVGLPEAAADALSFTIPAAARMTVPLFLLRPPCTAVSIAVH